MRDRLETWLRPRNLYLFLERLSAIITYPFDEWDSDAVRFGVGDAASEPGSHYEYELWGSPPVKLTFNGSGDASRLPVAVETEKTTAVRIDALARILQCYAEEASSARSLESLVEEAFADTPQPDPKHVVACTDAHLTVCLECQETLSLYGDAYWLTLLRDAISLPGAVGNLGLLTSEARRYFFPAYLLGAIREGDRCLLETAAESVAGESWTPLQEELIGFARHVVCRRTT